MPLPPMPPAMIERMRCVLREIDEMQGPTYGQLARYLGGGKNADGLIDFLIERDYVRKDGGRYRLGEGGKHFLNHTLEEVQSHIDTSAAFQGAATSVLVSLKADAVFIYVKGSEKGDGVVLVSKEKDFDVPAFFIELLQKLHTLS